MATDAGAILGIGDWGVGGIGIAVGKLAVYTAAAGIDPNRALPVMLDVGTDRQSLLDDPLYIGNRHPRVPAAEYDRFLESFVTAVGKLFPGALLHWEDIGVSNARRLLDRYRYQTLTFNDDIQGTGAVNLAAVLAAARATGVRLAEHRIVIFGAGTAGTGIADQLSAAMLADGLSEDAARARFWAVDRTGLITTATPDLGDSQRRYARAEADVAGWQRDPSLGGVGLAEVVHRVHPTILIGTSTRTGAFTEPIVRDMAAHCDRPVILPMSNPTSLSEAAPGRPDPVDGGPGPGGHRQPVPARRLPRGPVHDRPGQQRADLPRARPRRHRRPGQPGDRQHAGRRGARGVRNWSTPRRRARRCCPGSRRCARPRSPSPPPWRRPRSRTAWPGPGWTGTCAPASGP